LAVGRSELMKQGEEENLFEQGWWCPAWCTRARVWKCRVELCAPTNHPRKACYSLKRPKHSSQTVVRFLAEDYFSVEALIVDLRGDFLFALVVRTMG